jgi:hypothetical protein
MVLNLMRSRNLFMKKHYLKFILLVVLSLTGLHTASFAQSQQDREQSLLPDIDPQDIEIRSQFQARFPGLNRQPILGFNPRPRVYQIDPNRLPFLEDEEDVLASLPVGSLDRPEPPEYSTLGYRSPKFAFLRMGVGSDITPETDAFATAKIADNSWISGNVRFTSSDGHEEQLDTSYRLFDAGLNSYSRLSDRTTMRVNAGYISNFNRQLQLETDSESLLQAESKIGVDGIRGGVSLDLSETSLSGTTISVSGFANSFSVDSDLAPFNAADASEWGLNASGTYSRLGSNLNEVHRLQVRTKLGSVDPVLNESTNWSVSTLSAHYERLFNYQTDVHASLGVSAVTDSRQDFVLYFAPEAEINHRVFRGLDVRLKAHGKARHNSLFDVQTTNRFFDLGSNLRHQYEKMALGELTTEPFYGTKITGGVSVQDITNFMYFSRTEESYGFDAISEGYYSAQFNDAAIFKIYGAFTQDLKAEVLWLSAEAYLQRPRLSGEDRDIPFMETFSVESSLSFRPVKELLIEGWGEFKSGRESHTGESLSSYVTLGSRFEISLTENFGIYGKLLNILDEDYEYWDGFREHGFRGFIGLTVLL